MPGHATLGTAHSVGPPHLILISHCSRMMIQGLVLSNMPCSYWFSNKNPIKAPTGFKNPTVQAWTLIHLPSWIDGSAWTIHSVFLFPVFPTNSLCWWIRPGSGIPHREEEWVEVECHSSDLENVGCANQLPVYYLHSCFFLQLQIASVCTVITFSPCVQVNCKKRDIVGKHHWTLISSNDWCWTWTSWLDRPRFPPCRQSPGLLH